MSEACTHDPFLDIRKKNNRKIFKKKKKERERFFLSCTLAEAEVAAW